MFVLTVRFVLGIVDPSCLGNAIQGAARQLSDSQSLEFVNAYIDTQQLNTNHANSLSQVRARLKGVSYAIIRDIFALVFWSTGWKEVYYWRQDYVANFEGFLSPLGCSTVVTLRRILYGCIDICVCMKRLVSLVAYVLGVLIWFPLPVLNAGLSL